MTARHTAKLTANFEHNLAEIEVFLLEADIPQAFDVLLNELTDTVIPDLERFPGIGRLAKQLDVIAPDGELREYVTAHYLLLYAQIEGTIYLLSIRHQRQLSFKGGSSPAA